MNLPILMYHYVRPITKRLSPRHKVLDLELFSSQLEILQSRYLFRTSKELVQLTGEDISSNLIWLTFDDGYKDCIEYVLPVLLKHNAVATFYLPTEAIFERKLLDVNKIHILLSGPKTPRQIVEASSEIFNDLQIAEIIGISFGDLYEKYANPNLWNDGDTEFLKKLFQKALPSAQRRALLSATFEQLVDRPESSWVDEFYLTPDDVRRLFNSGMEIGSHSHTHEWLEDLTIDQQRSDLSESFRYLDLAIGSNKNRTMCYPFGSYNSDTLAVLSELSVKTAVVNDGSKFANFNNPSPSHLKLDRIDIMFFDQLIDGEFN